MSVLKQVIKLRDMFVGYVNQATDFNRALITGIAPATNLSFVNDKNVVVNLSTGGLLKFSNEDDDVVQEVDITQAGEDALQTQLLTRDVTIDLGQFKVGDMLSGVGEASDLYSVLAMMSSKFSYANRMSYSDVNSILSTVSDSDDVKKFKVAMLNATDGSGYITGKSFFATIESMFTQTKNSSDGGSFDVDDSSPFQFSALFSTILEMASPIFSVMFLAIRGILTGIIAVITIVFKSVFSIFNKIFETRINYDNSKLNIMTNCPVLAMDSMLSKGKPASSISYTDYEYYMTEIPVPHDRRVQAVDDKGIAIFKWWNPDYTDFRFNAYEYPWLDPFATIKWLSYYNGGLIEFLDNKLYFKRLSDWQQLVEWDSQYYKDFIRYCSYEGTGYQPENEIEVLYSLIIGLWIRTCFEMVKQSRLNNSQYLLANSTVNIIGFADPDEEVFQIPGYILNKLVNDSAFMDDPRLLLLNISMDSNNGYNYMADQWSKLMKDRFYAHNDNPVGEIWDSTDTSMLKVVSSSYYNFYMPYSYFVGTNFVRRVSGLTYISDPVAVDQYYSYGNSYQPDCIPSDFAISYPIAIGSEMAAVAIATAAIVTAAAVTIANVSKAIQKRKISKSLMRVKKVSDLRDDYLDDPTNKTKRQAYENAVYSYNKWGSVFGWGQYDGVNDWINFDDSEVSGIGLTNWLNATSTEADIRELILLIKQLIRAD